MLLRSFSPPLILFCETVRRLVDAENGMVPFAVFDAVAVENKNKMVSFILVTKYK